MQFELSRTVDSAAVDVLSAINAASPYLPQNIPYPPTIRKVNPAETPIMLIALSSDSLPAHHPSTPTPKTSCCRRFPRSPAVGLVGIGGQQKPAIRIQVNPQALAARQIGARGCPHRRRRRQTSICRRARSTARRVTYTLNTNDQLLNPAAYDELIIA